ncbi:hypothetical protein IFO70_33850 [Phormidium tenue FACHB-886]|nr:hypothetical protein [Phormidium tenue FACHB-886]
MIGAIGMNTHQAAIQSNDYTILIALALLKLVMHLLTNSQYGSRYLPDLPDLLPRANIPDDPEQAAEFWLEDATKDEGDRLTDAVKRPYGGFEQLLTARLIVQPPEELLAQRLEEIKSTRSRHSSTEPTFSQAPATTVDTLRAAKPTRPRKSERRLLSAKAAPHLLNIKAASQIDGEMVKCLRVTAQGYRNTLGRAQNRL